MKLKAPIQKIETVNPNTQHYFKRNIYKENDQLLKNQFIMKTLKTTFILILATFTMSCSTLYDHFTYTETIKTKLEAISLIEKSDSPYEDSEMQIINLKNQMEKMLIYEKGKDKNELTTKMWELLSSDKHLMGSYLKLWEEKGQLNPAFKEEAKPQIEKAFDLMIYFEEKKDKTSKNALTEFINQFNL